MAIDEEALRRAFAALQARVVYLEQASGLFASEDDLASPRGNPTVRFAPNRWRGADFKGKRYSECSPEFLEVLAEALHYTGLHPKEGKEKFAAGNLTDAARARSWARRLRGRAGANGASEPEPKKSAWGAPPPARSGAPPVDAAPAPSESAAPDPLADGDESDPLGGLGDDADEDPLGLDSPGP